VGWSISFVRAIVAISLFVCLFVCFFLCSTDSNVVVARF